MDFPHVDLPEDMGVVLLNFGRTTPVALIRTSQYNQYNSRFGAHALGFCFSEPDIPGPEIDWYDTSLSLIVMSRLMVMLVIPNKHEFDNCLIVLTLPEEHLK